MFIEFRFPNQSMHQNPDDPFLDVDVIDDETTVRLKIDVPGMNMGNLRVELHEGLLLVGCNRIPDDVSYRLRNRKQLSFSKNFTLDETLDNDRMEADCIDGVLTIVLWKKIPQ